MIRALATILLVGATVQPAQACHRFAHWKYPWPQRCGAVHSKPHYAALILPDARRRSSLVPSAPQPENRTAPDIVITPELLDEHDVGIAKLRALLR